MRSGKCFLMKNRQHSTAATEKPTWRPIAHGVYIYDENGKTLSGRVFGPVACSLGHSHRLCWNPLSAIWQDPICLPWSQFGSEEAEELAGKLADISPGKHYSHSFCRTAVRRQPKPLWRSPSNIGVEKGKTSKVQFISRQKSYRGHDGRTFSCIRASATAPAVWRKTFGSGPEKLTRDLEQDPLERTPGGIKSIIHHRPQKLQANSWTGYRCCRNAMVPPEGYYQAIKKFAKKTRNPFNGWWSNDRPAEPEVIFGWIIGRPLQTSWTAGKSLECGYAPIAATLMTDEILDPIREGRVDHEWPHLQRLIPILRCCLAGSYDHRTG